MIVPLVPLFLAANITAAANGNDWKYGAEVIYDARIDFSTHSIEKSETPAVFNVSTMLKCRSKTELSLSCVIHEPRILSTPKDPSKNKFKVPNEFFKFKEERQGGPFELNFDSDGLKEIVVSSSLDPVMFSVFKSLAGQMNFGANLHAIPINVFEIKSNPATGRCKTSYRILSDKFHGEDVKKSKKDPFEVVLVPSMIVPKGLVKGVVKTRHMDECLHRYDYYDDDWKEINRAVKERKQLPNPYYETELKSSNSRITIMENNFTSQTDETMTITDMKKKSPTVERMKQTMINLSEIVPAKGPLPNIEDPTTIDIYSIDRLRNHSSK